MSVTAAASVRKVSRSPVRALLFDLDETLVDGRATQAAIRAACEALAEESGVAVGALLHANNEAWQSYWPQVEEAWTLGRLASEDLSREVWRRTLLACGCDDAELPGRAGEIHAALAQAAVRAFDDVLPLFDGMPADVRLGLITNGTSDTQRFAIRKLGIEDRFDAVVISGEVGVAKPDVSAFRLALDELGVGISEAWHVGDSLRTDVAGARATGLTAVWLNRSGARRSPIDPLPHIEIESLTELPGLLGGSAQRLGVQAGRDSVVNEPGNEPPAR